MQKGSWITYQDKRIWQVDYTGLKGKEYVQDAIDTHLQFLNDMRGAPPKTGLMLADVTGSVIDGPAYTALKDTGVAISPKIHKIALLGVSSIKSAFLNMAIAFTGLNIRAFETKDEALNWLVK